ncbi:MAG TPA: sulfur carrier protein ThiS [Candidatus Acidoferrales bacterium]|nr:sulfur carrier protein ThiS [Candidatus Acidoferrales bacterium]
MTPAVTVVINGESREIPAGLTVNEMLARLGILAGRVALEYNQEILPRSRWDHTRVQSGDRFEIVHFVGGG